MAPDPVRSLHNPYLEMVSCTKIEIYTQCIREGEGIEAARYVFWLYSTCLFWLPPCPAFSRHTVGLSDRFFFLFRV